MASYGPGAAPGQYSSSSSPRPSSPHVLAQHERMVTALICRGLTDRQITQELSLSPSEVRHHIGEIYGKLGVHSRQELIDTVARVKFFVAGLSAATKKLKSPEQISDLDGYRLKPHPWRLRAWPN